MANRIALRTRARRGTTMTFSIVVSVVMSGLIASMAWVAGESSQRSGSLSKMDQAFFAAEAGAQRVGWYTRNQLMSSITSPLTGTVNGYNYSVSWSNVTGTTYAVISRGSSGNVSYTLSESVSGPGYPPVLTVCTDFDNKNVDIFGYSVVGGSYSNSGSGSLTWSLTYYVNVTDTGGISGTVAKGSGAMSTMNMTTLGASLIAAAGQTYNTSQTGTTFNFTALSGTNKVIYVNGDVTSPTFVGAGTLYASGKITTSGGGTTAALPVNLVAASDITFNNNITYYGAVYTGGNWIHGKVTSTGMIYVVGSTVLNGTGHSTLSQAAAPFFDQRIPTIVGTGVVFTGFTGPQP